MNKTLDQLMNKAIPADKINYNKISKTRCPINYDCINCFIDFINTNSSGNTCGYK